MTKEERKLINDAVAAIRDLIPSPNDEFGYNLECEEDFEDIARDFIDALYLAHIRADIRAGVSKLVIIPDKIDYVIKIPFNGQYKPVYDDGMYYAYDDFVRFSQAGVKFESSEWDYCETELEIYAKAKDYAVEELFDRTEFFMCVNHRPVYIQAKAISIEDWCGEEKESSPEAKKNYCYCKPEHEYIPREWVEQAIDYYGLDNVIRLKNFIDDYSLKDFHSGNVGYTFEGKPVIIDYAGWDD